MYVTEAMIAWVNAVGMDIAEGKPCGGCFREWNDNVLDHTDDCPFLRAEQIIFDHDRAE